MTIKQRVVLFEPKRLAKRLEQLERDYANASAINARPRELELAKEIVQCKKLLYGPNDERVVRALLRVADLHRYRRALASAEKVLRHTLAVAKRCPKPTAWLVAQAHNRLAEVQVHTKNWLAAERNFSTALQQLEALNPEERTAEEEWPILSEYLVARGGLCAVWRARDQPEGSKELNHLVTFITTKFRDPERGARQLSSPAVSFQITKQWPLVQAVYDWLIYLTETHGATGLELYADEEPCELDDAYQLALNYEDYADAAMACNQYEPAIPLWHRAIGAYVAAEMTEETAFCIMSLADCYWYIGDMEKAFDAYRRASDAYLDQPISDRAEVNDYNDRMSDCCDALAEEAMEKLERLQKRPRKPKRHLYLAK